MENFDIDSIKWKLHESQNITGNRVRPPAQRIGINSASITCKICDHHWTTSSSSSPRYLEFSPVEITVTCPSCFKKEKIVTRDFG